MIYWGIMTGRVMLGVFLAILVEAKRWVRLEWEFDDEACTRAWQFSCIAIGLVAVLVWLEGNRYEALPVLLTWLPPLLMPMQFVQAFGRRDSLPLNTFSFLARQRRNRNRRLGLPDSIYFIHFGNVLFVTTLVSASMGSLSSSAPWLFLGGIIILTGWMFVVKNRSGIVALGIAFSIVAGISIAGQIGLSKAYDWASNLGETGQTKFDPNSVDTLIGKPGKIQQSVDIIWRLTPQEGSPVPRLLRLASYGVYGNGTWNTDRVSALDFKDLDTLELTQGDAYFILNEGADQRAISPALPRFTLRGAAVAETPLPLPGNTSSLRDFALDGVERNSFGSVRIFPKSSVIDGLVLWNAETNPETPPLAREDLMIPPRERSVITQTAQEIGLLDEPDFNRKLELLRKWFWQNFKYSRDLKIFTYTAVVTQPTGIDKFLTVAREGHCEYFATAAVLLLREADIPSRYATGYVVRERDAKRNEMVIRGTHGHAWCRVWNEASQQWVDFDTTPPQGLASATPELTRMQRFNDALKRIREDFFLWRNRPNNRLASTLVMSTIALAVAGFVGRRLWKSKRRIESLKSFHQAEGPRIRTPLHDLEPHVRKHLGYRPAGQTFAAWLKRLNPAIADRRMLDDAIALHQRMRFDPAAEVPEDRAKLVEISKVIGEALR
jgi:hypothetical protein